MCTSSVIKLFITAPQTAKAVIGPLVFMPTLFHFPVFLNEHGPKRSIMVCTYKTQQSQHIKNHHVLTNSWEKVWCLVCRALSAQRCRSLRDRNSCSVISKSTITATKYTIQSLLSTGTGTRTQQWYRNPHRQVVELMKSDADTATHKLS